MAAGDVTSVVVQLTDGLSAINTAIEGITANATDPISISPTGAVGEFLVLSVAQS